MNHGCIWCNLDSACLAVPSSSLLSIRHRPRHDEAAGTERRRAAHRVDARLAPLGKWPLEARHYRISAAVMLDTNLGRMQLLCNKQLLRLERFDRNSTVLDRGKTQASGARFASADEFAYGAAAGEPEGFQSFFTQAFRSSVTVGLEENW